MSAELQRTTDILGVGTLGRQLLPMMLQTFQDIGATASICTMGSLDMNRATSSEPTGYGRDGVVDISPAPEQIQNAIGHAGSDEIARRHQRKWQPLAQGMIDGLLARHHQLGLVDGQALMFQGW